MWTSSASVESRGLRVKVHEVIAGMGVRWASPRTHQLPGAPSRVTRHPPSSAAERPGSSGTARWGPERAALHRPLLTLCVGLVLSLACAAENEPEPDRLPPPDPGFSVQDSAGVTVVLTKGPFATAPLAWQVDSVPDLVIGAGRTPEDQLFRVSGVWRLPGNGVAVVNAGSQELRLYDQEGRLRTRVGGRGRGPGEFEEPVLVPAATTDSLYIWDTALRRLQALAPDGHGPRSLQLTAWPTGAGTRPPKGVLGSHVLVERAGVWTQAYGQTAGAKEDPRDYLWYDTDAGTATPVALFTVVRNYIQLRPGRPSAMSGIPFASHPAVTPSASGVFITEGRRWEVREYDLEASVLRILRVALPGRPVTRAILAARIDADAAASRSGSREFWESLYSEMPIPDTLPSFQSLHVDPLGWLWAEVYSWDRGAPVEWMLFDPVGVARGTVRTPPGLRVSCIGEDYVLGVWMDEMGVEQVRRHRVRRTQEGPTAPVGP